MTIRQKQGSTLDMCDEPSTPCSNFALNKANENNNNNCSSNNKLLLKNNYFKIMDLI